MNFYKVISDGLKRELQIDRIYGVVVGVVSNNKDAEGRVKVTYPWLSDSEESQWARIASFMAGDKRGSVFIPEVGDEVLIAFEHGDINRPYVLGALWNGVDKPPVTNEDGKNNLRLLQSRSGHIIRLDDTDGSEKIEIIDKTGKNSVTWDTSSNKISIAADKDIEIKAAQGKILLEAQEIEIKSSANSTLEASGNMTIKGSVVNIN